MSFATREFEIIPRADGVCSLPPLTMVLRIQFPQKQSSGKQGWIQSTVKVRFQAPGYIACVASVSVGFGSKEIKRVKNTKKSRFSSFFAPKPHGNACYAGYGLQ